jgi:ABC-2 type transport system permease protein
MEAIFIMWLRQLKRYVRNKSRIIGSLGQPLLFLVALGYGMGSIYRRAGAGSYIDFLAPGVIAQSVLFTGMFNGTELIWDRQFGFLKETLAAPVSRLSIMIGRTIGGATIATLQGIIVFVLSLLVGFRPANIATLPLTFLAIFLVALIFTGIGTAIACTLEDFHGFQLIMNFLVMPLFFLSGALFPLDGLPKAMQYVVHGNPLTYGVDALRQTLIGSGQFPLTLDFAILIGLTGIVFVIGSRLFQKIQL